jgi:hypothetical protein
LEIMVLLSTAETMASKIVSLPGQLRGATVVGSHG